MESKDTVWVIAVVCIVVYLVVQVYNMAKLDAYNPVIVFGTTRNVCWNHGRKRLGRLLHVYSGAPRNIFSFRDRRKAY